MSTQRPPLADRPVPLIVADLDACLARRLSGEGWRLHRGFRIPRPWILDGLVCWGPATDDLAVATALDVAARGAGLVVTRLTALHEDTFIDDCRRLGLIQFDPEPHLTEHAGIGPTGPDPAWAGLLNLLLDGASIEEAARRCFISQRTAHRRLTEARRALGAASTTAAVVAWRQQRYGGTESIAG